VLLMLAALVFAAVTVLVSTNSLGNPVSLFTVSAPICSVLSADSCKRLKMALPHICQSNMLFPNGGSGTFASCIEQHVCHRHVRVSDWSSQVTTALPKLRTDDLHCNTLTLLL
jgi:hypothetical protein